MTPTGTENSPWQRFLGGKTTAQRLLIALGAIAGAVVAIGGLIAAVAQLVPEGGGPQVRAADEDGEVQRIANQSPQADGFVKLLLSAVDGSPLQLDHQVLAPRGEGGSVRLEYDCAAPTGCSYTRLETGRDIPAEVPGGIWYQGCWAVKKDGAGYRADRLDIELYKQGDTCAGNEGAR